MGNRAQGREGRFIDVGRGYHGVPAGSRVFRGAEVDDTRECSWRLLPCRAGLA
jgi:hypothetical protein